jgi:hypothetical protein
MEIANFFYLLLMCTILSERRSVPSTQGVKRFERDI